jgi:hypothetical protein
MLLPPIKKEIAAVTKPIAMPMKSKIIVQQFWPYSQSQSEKTS